MKKILLSTATLMFVLSFQAHAQFSFAQVAWTPLCQLGLQWDSRRGRCVRQFSASIESSGVVITPVDTAASDSLPEYYPGAEDVLLIHGFSFGAGHNCQDYFMGQHFLLSLVLAPRAVKTVGYYQGNTHCDVDIDGHEDNDTNTSIAEIAEELALYIIDAYPPGEGEGVDIVAHSMGGIVVRKMLEDWGHRLNVDQVVTLGSPHGGYRIAAASLCPAGIAQLPGQCTEMKQGSPFIELLEENPQSNTETSWSLIATDRDEVIGGSFVWEPAGSGPGTAMEQGAADSPEVRRFTYSSHYGIQASFGPPRVIRHGSLVGLDSISTFVYSSWSGNTEVRNPTQRVLDFISD